MDNSLRSSGEMTYHLNEQDTWIPETRQFHIEIAFFTWVHVWYFIPSNENQWLIVFLSERYQESWRDGVMRIFCESFKSVSPLSHRWFRPFSTQEKGWRGFPKMISLQIWSDLLEANVNAIGKSQNDSRYGGIFETTQDDHRILGGRGSGTRRTKQASPPVQA